MKRNFIQLFFCALCLFALSPLAFAQATRTWISGVGDDANPCSRTAPCKTWAGAISKTAPAGEIDALDPGGFGALTITKSITLDGGGGQVASVLVSGTNGIVVQAASTDTVIIRNVRFNGLLGNSASAGLNGIRFISGQQLVVENCEIFGFSQNGIDVALNQTTSASVAIHNVNLSHIGQIGLSFVNAQSGTLNGSVSNTHIREAASGIAVSAAGGNVDVSDSVITQMSGFGLHAFTGTISAERNMLSASGTAVRTETAGTIRLSDNGIYNNSFGIRASGPVSSANNNRNAGNATPGAPTTTITIQ